MAGIVNYLASMLAPTKSAKVVSPIRVNVANEVVTSHNNPFVATKGANPFANYAKNKPVAGGYFAGYYNNKPNIVGQRLFVEV